jgi:hypothetical protein
VNDERSMKLDRTLREPMLRCHYEAGFEMLPARIERVALFHFVTRSRVDFAAKMARGAGSGGRPKAWNFFIGVARCAAVSSLCACIPQLQARHAHSLHGSQGCTCTLQGPRLHAARRAFTLRAAPAPQRVVQFTPECPHGSPRSRLVPPPACACCVCMLPLPVLAWPMRAARAAMMNVPCICHACALRLRFFRSSMRAAGAADGMHESCRSRGRHAPGSAPAAA